MESYQFRQDAFHKTCILGGKFFGSFWTVSENCQQILSKS